MTLYVFRPNGVCDWSVFVEADLGDKYVLSTGAKIKKTSIDTGKSFYGGFYFTTSELRDNFTEKYYAENKLSIDIGRAEIMKKVFHYDDKIFNIKELEEYTRMKELTIYTELIETGKVEVANNVCEFINIYDMLIFEDESGSIYQDCVCSIEHCKDGNVYKLNGAVLVWTY